MGKSNVVERSVFIKPKQKYDSTDVRLLKCDSIILQLPTNNDHSQTQKYLFDAVANINLCVRGEQGIC